MFWRFGCYGNSSAIDTILDKPDFVLEDLLDEGDLLQEVKQHNAKLIEYLRQDHVLQLLLDYVVAPRLVAVDETVAEPESLPEDEEFRENDKDNDKDQEPDRSRGRILPFVRPRATSKAAVLADADNEEQEKRRNRYAYIAAEVLVSDTWSIYEALIESPYLIQNFWGFLERSEPPDPLQASYFTKVNEVLFDKKTAEMMQILMSIPNAAPSLLGHVGSPMIMDLLLKIIAMERHESGRGIVEVSQSQKRSNLKMLPPILTLYSGYTRRI